MTLNIKFCVPAQIHMLNTIKLSLTHGSEAVDVIDYWVCYANFCSIAYVNVFLVSKRH